MTYLAIIFAKITYCLIILIFILLLNEFGIPKRIYEEIVTNPLTDKLLDYLSVVLMTIGSGLLVTFLGTTMLGTTPLVGFWNYLIAISLFGLGLYLKKK